MTDTIGGIVLIIGFFIAAMFAYEPRAILSGTVWFVFTVSLLGIAGLVWLVMEVIVPLL